MSPSRTPTPVARVEDNTDPLSGELIKNAVDAVEKAMVSVEEETVGKEAEVKTKRRIFLRRFSISLPKLKWRRKKIEEPTVK